MNATQEKEMVETYESYEPMIRKKLEELDFLSRKLFIDIGIFGVPKRDSYPYVQEKVDSLIRDVMEKGDGSSELNKFRASREKYSRPYAHIQANRETSQFIRGVVCQEI